MKTTHGAMYGPSTTVTIAAHRTAHAATSYSGLSNIGSAGYTSAIDPAHGRLQL